MRQPHSSFYRPLAISCSKYARSRWRRSGPAIAVFWAAAACLTLAFFAMLSLNTTNDFAFLSSSGDGNTVSQIDSNMKRKIQGRVYESSGSNNGGKLSMSGQAPADASRDDLVKHRHLFTERRGTSDEEAVSTSAKQVWAADVLKTSPKHSRGSGSPRITLLQGKHSGLRPMGNQLIFDEEINKADITVVGEARDSNMTRALEKIKRKYHAVDSAMHAARTDLNNRTNLHEFALSKLPQDLTDRRKLLREKCDQLGLSNYPPNAWEFVINPEYQLVYCNVFKVASTSWITVFNQLAGLTEVDLKNIRKTPVSIMRMMYPRPTPGVLKHAVKENLSFIVVRDPLERILSAYRDKLENAKNGHYKMVGAMMAARKHGFNYALHHGPTFGDFVDYILTSERRGQKLNEHWVPYYRFCTPCSLNFTVIAKTETLQRDSEFILDTSQVPEYVAVTQRNSNTAGRTRSLLEKYYSQLSEEQIRGLYDIYSPDFELFGYDFAPYFEMVKRGGEK